MSTSEPDDPVGPKPLASDGPRKEGAEATHPTDAAVAPDYIVPIVPSGASDAPSPHGQSEPPPPAGTVPAATAAPVSGQAEVAIGMPPAVLRSRVASLPRPRTGSAMSIVPSAVLHAREPDEVASGVHTALVSAAQRLRRVESSAVSLSATAHAAAAVSSRADATGETDVLMHAHDTARAAGALHVTPELAAAAAVPPADTSTGGDAAAAHRDPLRGAQLEDDGVVPAVLLRSFSGATPTALPSEDELNAFRVLWHSMPFEELVARVGAQPDRGLQPDVAQRRLAVMGPNTLTRSSSRSNPVVLFLRNLFGFLSILLMVALILSFVTAEYVEGGVLAFIVVFNAVLGFTQEYRSERTLEALMKLTAARCKVLRGGQVKEVAATTLVVGDVVVLDTGDAVPADLRLIVAQKMEVDESALTGESVPVRKRVGVLPAGSTVLPLGDRINMVYAGCFVARGRGRGLVVATGNSTELGHIARGVTETEKRASFLSVEIRNMSILLFAAGAVMAVVVFAANRFVYRKEILIYAITLLISAIPESLPLMLTLTMSFGMRKMAERNAVVRRMPVLETLGRVTNICSDKTGTLTQARMAAVTVWLPHRTYTVLGDPQSDDGGLSLDGKTITAPDAATAALLDCCALCNDAQLATEGAPLGRTRSFSASPAFVKHVVGGLSRSPAAAVSASPAKTVSPLPSSTGPAAGASSALGRWQAVGTATEIALAFLAVKHGVLRQTALEARRLKVVAEWPFDSSTKSMTVVVKDLLHNTHTAYVKGAPERVLRTCRRLYGERGPVPIDADFSGRVQQSLGAMSARGQRVIAVAYRPNFAFRSSQVTDRAHVDDDLVFLGLVGIWDPPRPESAPAVTECREAGITVHMLTGDHPSTATAIANDIGIVHADDGTLRLVTVAPEFDAIPQEELDNIVELPRVLARCSPDTKVRMVHALHRRGRIVVMTGDGVNDAPALKAADVGVAMGSGTEVTKQAADLVLVDNNFASIVAAIEEGRRIFVNIKKFFVHELSSNIASLLLLTVGLAFRGADDLSINPVSALQAIWLNTLIVAMPSLALSREPNDVNLMKLPPDVRNRGVFSPEVRADVLVYGCLIGALSLATYAVIEYGAYGGLVGVNCNEALSLECAAVFRARAATFVAFGLMLLVNAFDCRDSRKYLWQLGLLSNRALLLALGLGAASLVALVYIPFVNTELLKHSPISWEWGVCVGAVVCMETLVQVYKAIKNRFWPIYTARELEMEPL